MVSPATNFQVEAYPEYRDDKVRKADNKHHYYEEYETDLFWKTSETPQSAGSSHIHLQKNGRVVHMYCTGNDVGGVSGAFTTISAKDYFIPERFRPIIQGTNGARLHIVGGNGRNPCMLEINADGLMTILVALSKNFNEQVVYDGFQTGDACRFKDFHVSWMCPSVYNEQPAQN